MVKVMQKPCINKLVEREVTEKKMKKYQGFPIFPLVSWDGGEGHLPLMKRFLLLGSTEGPSSSFFSALHPPRNSIT